MSSKLALDASSPTKVVPDRRDIDLPTVHDLEEIQQLPYSIVL